MTIQIDENDEEVEFSYVSEEICSLEWPAKEGVRLIDDLERLFQVRDRRLLLISRNRIMSFGGSFSRRVQSKIRESYPDALIHSTYIGENYLYMTAFVSSFTKESLKSFKNGPWLVGPIPENDEMLNLDVVAAALEAPDLAKQVGKLLTHFSFAIRLWPWDPDDLWQCFTVPERTSV